MKEWHRTIILLLLLFAAIVLIIWSRSESIPTIN